MEIVESFLAADIRTSTPLLIAALGIVFSARAGIINIGTEGFMLVGAFFGVVGSWLTGSSLGGALFAMAAGLLLSLVFAFFTVGLRANQTVVGIAVNVFASGLTISLNRLVFGTNAGRPSIDVFENLPIPGLSQLPFFGRVFFNYPLLTYLAFLAVPVAAFVMNRTNIGLQIRAVGEVPKACDTLGINVFKVRYLTILFGGLMAGLAGAFTSLGQLSFFSEGMIAGRGFIVLAVVIVGGYAPVGAMLATLLFGAGEALQFRLQAANTGIPYQIWTILPYLITLLALCGFMRKGTKPAASGIPYEKG